METKLKKKRYQLSDYQLGYICCNPSTYKCFIIIIVFYTFINTIINVILCTMKNLKLFIIQSGNFKHSKAK